MGIFGKKTVPGISAHELTEHHNRLQRELDGVFPTSFSSSKLNQQKRAALHTALGLGMDRDPNMSSTQKRGAIQREEFEAAIGGGMYSPKEVDKLRKIAEKYLKD